MSRYRVFSEDPSDEWVIDFVEVEARDADEAARVYVHKSYENGWTDAFTLWVQDEDGETRQVDVSVRSELVVDVRSARSKDGAR